MPWMDSGTDLAPWGSAVLVDPLERNRAVSGMSKIRLDVEISIETLNTGDGVAEILELLFDQIWR